MRILWIKLVNLLLILFLLFGYNMIIKDREQKDVIGRLDAELQNTKYMAGNKEEQAENINIYADGIYEGEGKGFGGSINVEVTIEEGRICKIDVVSADNEDGAYLDMAEGIVDTVIMKQSADVDTISGATFSSTGIRSAVSQALQKAGI